MLEREEGGRKEGKRKGGIASFSRGSRGRLGMLTPEPGRAHDAEIGTLEDIIVCCGIAVDKEYPSGIL